MKLEIECVYIKESFMRMLIAMIKFDKLLTRLIKRDYLSLVAIDLKEKKNKIWNKFDVVKIKRTSRSEIQEEN